MKKIVTFLFALSLFPLQAMDLLILNSGKAFSGEVIRASKRNLTFKAYNNTFVIPLSDIAFVGLDEIAGNNDDPSKLCLAASNDARLRGRVFNNLLAGGIFGPLAIGYDLLKNYGPKDDWKVVLHSSNAAHFNDPTYLYCYNRQAKLHATAAAAVGMIVWPAWYRK